MRPRQGRFGRGRDAGRSFGLRSRIRTRRGAHGRDRDLRGVLSRFFQSAKFRDDTGR